jgi:hypothetical protein
MNLGKQRRKKRKESKAPSLETVHLHIDGPKNPSTIGLVAGADI